MRPQRSYVITWPPHHARIFTQATRLSSHQVGTCPGHDVVKSSYMHFYTLHVGRVSRALFPFGGACWDAHANRGSETMADPNSPSLAYWLNRGACRVAEIVTSGDGVGVVVPRRQVGPGPGDPGSKTQREFQQVHDELPGRGARGRGD